MLQNHMLSLDHHVIDLMLSNSLCLPDTDDSSLLHKKLL